MWQVKENTRILDYGSYAYTSFEADSQNLRVLLGFVRAPLSEWLYGDPYNILNVL